MPTDHARHLLSMTLRCQIDVYQHAFIVVHSLMCQHMQATPAIRAMPTQSGRFLLSAKDQPLTTEEKQEMAAVIKENPEAQAKLADLADAAQMGLQLNYAKSPAFIGLAVIDVHSAELEGYKSPQIQIVCEDDKVCRFRAFIAE